MHDRSAQPAEWTHYRTGKWSRLPARGLSVEDSFADFLSDYGKTDRDFSIKPRIETRPMFGDWTFGIAP